jgi:hypothetical protein
MKTILICFALCVSLTACLKQNYPNNGSSISQGQKIQGAFVLRDWHGHALEKPEGQVLAQFVNTAQREVLRAGLRLPQLVKNASSQRVTTQCEILHEPKSNQKLLEFKASSDATVSMGKISFGNSANNLVPLLEGNNHLYQLSLQPGFESGIYLASIEGNAKTPGFSIKISMPERMGKAFVAGQDFETSATAFRKSEPLQLSWDAPKGEFDIEMNQMEFELISETDKEVVSLICGIKEKDLLTNSSTVQWEIPSNYLQALEATTSGLAILKRGQWMRASSPEIGVVNFEGVRIYATQALIAE